MSRRYPKFRHMPLRGVDFRSQKGKELHAYLTRLPYLQAVYNRVAGWERDDPHDMKRARRLASGLLLVCQLHRTIEARAEKALEAEYIQAERQHRQELTCLSCGVDFSRCRDFGYCNRGPGCLNPEWVGGGSPLDDGEDESYGCDLCGQDHDACTCTDVELGDRWAWKNAP